MGRLPTIIALIAGLSWAVSSAHAQQDPAQQDSAQRDPAPFAIFYGESTGVSLAPYRLLVFDADRHPPLAPLRQQGKRVLGYLSIGEVHESRSYFEAVRLQQLLTMKNQDWSGAHAVDLRDKRWRDRVVHSLVPQILRAGFSGVFLDTADSAIAMERDQPQSFPGMIAATADLVLAIRRNFPAITIMLNRGYEILDRVDHAVDIVLGESVYADYDFKTERYGLVAPETYRLQVDWLKAAQKRNPRLAVYTLDYWDPADQAGVARIYAVQRANGFVPYVATVALDLVLPEPRR